MRHVRAALGMGCVLSAILSPLHATTTTSRSFEARDLATISEPLISRPVPVAGLTLFVTQSADAHRLRFVVDPARITAVDAGAGAQSITAGEIVDVVGNPGAVFDLSNASIVAVDSSGIFRIVVPYFVHAGMHEWGYEKFMLHAAEIDVDQATRVATIVARDIDIGLDTFPSPVSVLPHGGAPVIVFTFREWNDFIDRDGDGYYGDNIALHNLVTGETFYTHLKSGGNIFGFVNETECAVNPGTEVDGLQMIAGGSNGLVAFTSQEIQFGPANGDVPCDRPGVAYNNDGDADDVAIRYATVSDLLNGAGLTLGPIVSDFINDEVIFGEQGPAGFMIGTDGTSIFFAPNSKTSFTLHAFDVPSSTTMSLESSIVQAPGVSRSERGIVAFAADDGALRFYDRSVDTIVVTNIVGVDVPASTDGDVIVFGSVEGESTHLKMIRLTPPPPPPPTDDEVVEGRMKGQGSLRASSATLRFDFAVGERDPQGEHGTLTVDVNYSEKGRRSDRFKSRTVSHVAFASDGSVEFSGVGEWNGAAGYTYVASAADRGEPGRLVDTFDVAVTAPNGATVATFAGVIDAGNIQSLPIGGRR